MQPRRVLVLGGGFGGVSVAQELERLAPRLPVAIDVTLVSQDNYLLFLPMLPEAAAGSIELTHILSPLRSLLPRTRLRIESVQSVDLERRTVTSIHGATHREQVLSYDYLVVALGNLVNLAGMPGVAQHGLPIKTVGDALHIRNRTLEMLEGAENAEDVELRRSMLTFVVAGGGFSGVEVAAELNDFLREAARVYRNFSRDDVRVILLHSGQRILPELSEPLALFAQRKLAQRGVEIRLGERLASATAQSVTLAAGGRISTHTLIVALGAGPNPVVQQLAVPKERGRIQVDEMLRIIGHEDVWALGDCAAVPNPKTGEASPPTAQFALREGKTVARNIAAAIRSVPQEPFGFTGLGQLVSLGHRSAVAEVLDRIRLAGPLAWLMWRAFYLFRLPGLDRKLRVWLDWNLDLLFRRDLAQLNVERTERVSMAHYEAGEIIIKQGDPADVFYVIVKGEVQVVREAAGQEQELARLGQGDSFGEVGILKRQRRNATVRAVGHVDVIALGRTDFDLLAATWRNLGSVLEGTTRERDSGELPIVKPGAAMGSSRPGDSH